MPFEPWLRALGPVPAAVLALLENLLIFALAVGLGDRLDVSAQAGAPEGPSDLGALASRLAAGTILLNALVTWVGWALWRAGWIRVRAAGLPESLGDALILLVLMDLAMYLLHRVAHHPWVYGAVHALHHRYASPRPLTLFVMHPLEVLGFGGLWLVVIALRPPTWGGMGIYLALNVAFGVVGHMAADPLPLPPRLERWLGTSAFHRAHHRDPASRFGFYTRVWDRLLGPRYT